MHIKHPQKQILQQGTLQLYNYKLKKFQYKRV